MNDEDDDLDGVPLSDPDDKDAAAELQLESLEMNVPSLHATEPEAQPPQHPEPSSKQDQVPSYEPQSDEEIVRWIFTAIMKATPETLDVAAVSDQAKRHSLFEKHCIHVKTDIEPEWTWCDVDGDPWEDIKYFCEWASKQNETKPAVPHQSADEVEGRKLPEVPEPEIMETEETVPKCSSFNSM